MKTRGSKRFAEVSDTVLQQKLINNYIAFFVLLAISIGTAITFIALGVHGNEPKLISLLPIVIILICILPTYNILKRANEQKKELKSRKLMQ